MARQKPTNTQRYWNDPSALESMASFLDYMPTVRYLADHFFNYRQHGRRLPTELKASLINEAISWGWVDPSPAPGTGG